jgi:WD40 repeat protein
LSFHAVNPTSFIDFDRDALMTDHHFRLRPTLTPWVAICAMVALLLLSFASSCQKGPLSPEVTVDTRDIQSPLVVACRSNLVVFYQNSDRVRIVDLHTNELGNASIGEGLCTQGAGVSADGTKLFVLAKDDRSSIVQVWDSKVSTCRKTIRVPDFVRSQFVVDSDGTHAFVATSPPDNSVIYRVDIEKGTTDEVFGPGCQTHATIKWNSDWIEPFAVSTDGRYLVVRAGLTTLVWNLEKKQDRFLCSRAAGETCGPAAVSPDGAKLVTGSGTVELWDFRSGKHIRRLWARGTVRGSSRFAAFSPDGKFLVAGITEAVGFPSHLLVWRTSDYSSPVVLQCHTEMLRSMSFLPGTNRIATAADHDTVRIWNFDELAKAGSANGEEKKGDKRKTAL